MWNIMIKNIDKIFSHFSNILICGAITLGGEIAINNPEKIFGGEPVAIAIGLLLFLTSFFLFMLNAYHGITSFHNEIDKIEEIRYYPKFFLNIFSFLLGIIYSAACIQIMFSVADSVSN